MHHRIQHEYDPDWGNFHDRQFDPPDEPEEDDDEDTWDEWTSDDEWKRRREDPY